ncbi:putative acetyl-CoA carboxylase biotin carboxyl carrier protein subunit [Thalassoglobus neptunius]|uniref:Putative acetyl-CoA carboxylase biotin carboxyl carrier protein subunit n=1 Tax=Thalassoglobus neptunius TaxID=1938619 RepID=A0A5C5WZ75_9PLAN|nr:HlyD family efflux transporter periplasmic adaptor subunit [Thalassoglobus neptunius]TWT55850.1 putative acetyl-CoA carboxylase biotin carboxyl carrier protein subunit [Thalassoglobus neptunius]
MSRSVRLVWASAFLFVSLSSPILAQRGDEELEGIEIERVAVSLKPPTDFRVPLRLEPSRTLRIVAPMDGVVEKVYFKAADSVRAQAEVIRFDSQQRQYELKIAQSEHELAKIEESLATDNQKKIAAARLDVARKKLDLAEFRSNSTVVHAAMDGVVSQRLVAEGQMVKAGDLLLVLVDPNELFVEIPIERGKVEAGTTIPVQVEDKQVDAKVDAILEPLPEFDPLRELFVSVATARLLLDASDGDLQSGQAVISEMIPRHPVAEIPITAIRTDVGSSDSERMIQVIRDGFVRSLPVQLLGQVGQTHVFVSARFNEGDEVILSASEELDDGSWVRPMLAIDEIEQTPSRGRPGRGGAATTGRGSVMGPDGIRRPVYNPDSD